MRITYCYRQSRSLLRLTHHLRSPRPKVRASSCCQERRLHPPNRNRVRRNLSQLQTHSTRVGMLLDSQHPQLPEYIINLLKINFENE